MVSPGTLLSGRYRIEDRVASGGMGDVWRGTDEVLGRTVAIKIMLQALLEEPGFVERFRAEARTMATVNHSGVVRIYDFGNDQQIAYLIMEYVEGDALSRTLNKVGRLTPARTLSLIAQAGDALHAAHEKGIVHRDVKPGNLLVRPNGTLVLTDFGIARSAAAAQLTATGAVMGTASYLAPEQAAGSVASAASDVYSLGVVAYQCLSGHRPYEGDTPLEIAMKHVTGTPRPMPTDIPPVVRQLVERAMAKEPGQRWASAAGFAAAARQAAAVLNNGGGATLPVQPVSSTPVSPSPVSGSPVSPARPVNGLPGGSARLPQRPLNPAEPAQARVNAGGAVHFQHGSAQVHAPAPQARAVPYSTQPVVTGRSGGRTTLIVLAVVLLMVSVLLCAGYIGWRLKRERLLNLGHSDYATISAGAWLNGADQASIVEIGKGRRTQ